MNKRIGIAAAVVLAVLIVGTYLILHTGKPNTIRIGGVYALTGEAASFGNWVKNGVDVAVEEINKSGGVNGKNIEVISEDTQSDPKRAVAAFEKLVSINRVPASVGFITSTEALACAPIAQRSKVIMITPIAGTPKLDHAGDYVFRTRESGGPQSVLVANHIYKGLGIREAALLCENAANAVGYRDAFIAGFTALGGKITANLSYDSGQTDFRAVLTQLKGMNPKAVYMPGVGKTLGPILKQARELGLGSQFFSSAGIEDPELFRTAGDAANGVVYGAPAFAVDSKDSATQRFVSAYRSRFHEDPSVYSANAYDAVMLIAGAMRKGAGSPAKMRDYLHDVKDYHGASGILTFDENGQVSKPVVLRMTKDANFVNVDR